jgi:hypothetical protein
MHCIAHLTHLQNEQFNSGQPDQVDMGLDMDG